MALDHVDVLIVGAGISGIGAAYHLQKQSPKKTFLIIEARDSIGGTWDLFQYPGIRSDSDMYTFGYAFRPWVSEKSIAEGASIVEYLTETVEEYGIDRKIRFRRRAVHASWSSQDALWTVDIRNEDTGEIVRMTCQFLFMCTGYYNYAEGYMPEFPGAERFKGQLIHAQKWTPDIAYEGKRIVVIGSGATAVTLVPALAQKAEHVTMLQRSPSYVVARPQESPLVKFIRTTLPERMAFAIIRWIYILFSVYFFNRSRKNPDGVKAFILNGVREQLGPDYDVEKHFTPTYNVWDQRVCLTPDGDFFEVIRDGRASVVTDHIQTFTETGVQTRTGETLEADMIVAATGLKLQLMSDMPFVIDGEKVNPARSLQYRGAMFSDIPNLAWTFGYVAASWTLKADLTAEYVCRLLNYMDKKGFRSATPRITDPEVEPESMLDFSSGYVLRGLDVMPKQGTKEPWQLRQNYLYDIFLLRYGKLEDGAMTYA